MPTRGRQDLIHTAISCWRAQTYRNRDLVIVDDESDPSLPFGIEEDDIHYFLRGGISTIGEKRNLCVQLSTGEVIAHFDSDDWSDPGRLTDQVTRLLDTGTAVTSYQDMFFTDGVTRWIYHHASPATGLGTSLAYWRAWALAHPFPPMPIGEDGVFIREAFASVKHPEPGDLVCPHMLAGSPRCTERLYSGVSGLGMMIARRHGANTSQQSMSDPNYLVWAPYPGE